MDYHDENDFLHSLLSFNLKLLKNFAAVGRVVKFLSWKFKIMHTYLCTYSSAYYTTVYTTNFNETDVNFKNNFLRGFDTLRT